MKTLEKTMTEFVLEKEEERNLDTEYTSFEFMEDCVNYAKLLSTPLTLGMFIPCDEDGNVLEEPKNVNYQTDKMFDIALKRYKKALSNVLFEGFEVENKSKFTLWIENKENTIVFTDRGKINMGGKNVKTIEDLIPYKLKLTDNFTID